MNCSPVDALYPESRTELVQVVHEAQAHKQSLIASGAGTKVQWGSLLSAEAQRVSIGHLHRVAEYSPTDLTITVECGISLKNLQAVLGEHQQWWPVDPYFPDQATVGGILATADTGSLRHRYGSLRDLILGVEWVRADGQMAKAGGRVVKNVAGYDIMKLLTGSWGTLAIMTQVTLRLYPLPLGHREVLWCGSASQVTELATTLLASTLLPVAVDVLSPAVIDPSRADGLMWGLAVQFHAAPASLDIQTEQLRQFAVGLGLTVRDPLPDLTRFWTDTPGVLAKIGIPTDPGLSVLAQLGADHPAIRLQIHTGSGLGRWWMPEEAVDAALIQKWRTTLEAYGGFFTLLTAPDSLKTTVDMWGLPQGSRALQERLRQNFDPESRFSPGRFPFGASVTV